MCWRDPRHLTSGTESRTQRMHSCECIIEERPRTTWGTSINLFDITLAAMAQAIRDFLKNHLPSPLFGGRNREHHESREYLHVENQGESDEDEIVYPSEEMTKANEKESSKNTSALQAAWNVLNLIQGKFQNYNVLQLFSQFSGRRKADINGGRKWLHRYFSPEF